MKIDTDLRQAVRSSCNAQPDEGWAKRAEREKAEVMRVVMLPRHRAKSDKMIALQVRARTDLETAEHYFNSLGVCGNLSGVYDESKFKSMGGTIPQEIRKWRYDAVMSELAAAKPAQRKAILKKYGINWE